MPIRLATKYAASGARGQLIRRMPLLSAIGEMPARSTICRRHRHAAAPETREAVATGFRRARAVQETKLHAFTIHVDEMLRHAILAFARAVAAAHAAAA